MTIHDEAKRHCLNGWAPTWKYPACNYTGGHFCIRYDGHKGKCKCTCGSTSASKPPSWDDVE